VKKYVLLFLQNFEEIVAGICLAIMVGVTFVNVMGRYLFTAPLTWGDEFCLFLAGWAVFLGMSAAYKRNQHLGMEFLLNHLNNKNKMRLQQLLTLVMLILCIILMKASWDFTFAAAKRTQIMRIHYRYVYASAGTGFTLMTIHSAVYLYQSIFKKEKFWAHFYPGDADELPQPSQIEEEDA